MRHVVAAHDDHDDVGARLYSLLDLGRQVAGFGADDGEAVQVDRPGQLLGHAGRDQRAGCVAGQVHPVAGRGGVAEDGHGHGFARVLCAVAAAAPGRRGLGRRDDAAGHEGLAEKDAGEQRAGGTDTSAAECGGGDCSAELAHRPTFLDRWLNASWSP